MTYPSVMAPQVRDLLELCDALEAHDEALWERPAIFQSFLDSGAMTRAEYGRLIEAMNLCRQALVRDAAVENLIARPKLLSDLRSFIEMLKLVETFTKRKSLSTEQRWGSNPFEGYENRLTSVEHAVAGWTVAHTAMQTHVWSVYHEYRFTAVGSSPDEKLAANRPIEEFYAPLLEHRDRFFLEPSSEYLEQYVAIAHRLNAPENPLAQFLKLEPGPRWSPSQTDRAAAAFDQLAVASLMAALLVD